jgi:hypothetical protein
MNMMMMLLEFYLRLEIYLRDLMYYELEIIDDKLLLDVNHFEHLQEVYLSQVLGNLYN